LRLAKRIERSGKRGLRSILKKVLRIPPLALEDFDGKSVSKILVVRQDSRLGNIILMTPLLSGLAAAFPGARVDVLVSEGFEDVLENHEAVGRVVAFRKSRARLSPLWFLKFLFMIRGEGYDLAIDVSDGRHFSFNNVLLTSLSGARYRYGYDREDASRFLNLTVPVPPEGTHMADALFRLVSYLAPETGEFPMSYTVTEEDGSFARQWLDECGIGGFDSFFVVHPGGRGKKQWGAANFAELIDRLTSKLGVRMVVIGGPAEDEVMDELSERAESPFEILQDITVGQMAAVIERCDLFISNDTGPMHLAAALGKPVIGIFVSSDYRVYGPRGEKSRIVVRSEGKPTVEDVEIAVMDLLKSQAGLGFDAV